MEMNNVKKTPHDRCIGCAACMNGCTMDAIKMQPDKEGFLCPNIDMDKCIDCGECVRICPVLKEPRMGSDELECYAAWSKDEDVRYQSTSGGVFTHLAQSVIENGGAVVGARYRSDKLVEHAAIRNEAEIEQLRQSKYVQSDVGFVFREVKEELPKGNPLLFVGTPCQCEGLRSYLGEDYNNLVLCDFICRGVNSPSVYLAYLKELEGRYGSKVKQVWFKNKTFGWNNFATKIMFESGEDYIADRETDPFMLGYIKSKTTLYMRKSCYQCRFKGVSRAVDITLGDFWGIERVFPNIDTTNGVSAVMVHSEKGKKIFKNIGNRIFYKKCNISDVFSSNKCMITSVSANGEDRKKFLEGMEMQSSFFEIIMKWRRQ